MLRVTLVDTCREVREGRRGQAGAGRDAEWSGRGQLRPDNQLAPGRSGGAGAGHAARRRDVTVAAAVVGAGSAAAKCELRRARAGGGAE